MKKKKKNRKERKKERIIKPILLNVVLCYESCFIFLHKLIRPIFYFIDQLQPFGCFLEGKVRYRIQT